MNIPATLPPHCTTLAQAASPRCCALFKIAPLSAPLPPDRSLLCANKLPLSPPPAEDAVKKAAVSGIPFATRLPSNSPARGAESGYFQGPEPHVVPGRIRRAVAQPRVSNLVWGYRVRAGGRFACASWGGGALRAAGCRAASRHVCTPARSRAGSQMWHQPVQWRVRQGHVFCFAA